MPDTSALRAVDARLALPVLARRATVIGDLPEWTHGLEEAGVELVGLDRAEMAVVSPAELHTLTNAGIPVVVPAGGRRPRLPGRTALRLRSMPADRPRLLLHLGHRQATGFALGHLLDPTDRRRGIRNRVAATAARRGALAAVMPPDTVVYVASGDEPALIHAARAAGAPAGDEWCMVLSSGHTERKCAFIVFDEGAPAYVIKFRRRPGYVEEFDRSAAGIERATAAAPVVADRAPRLLARLELHGHPVIVESAVPGTPLQRLLAKPDQTRMKLDAAERVAAWLADVGRVTGVRSPDRISGRATFEHGDVWEENVFLDGDRLGLIDWDRCRSAGRPLWDLVYFAVHVLPSLANARTQDDRYRTALSVVRGHHEGSDILRRWIATYLSATGISPDSVGPLLAESWREWIASYRQPPAAESWFVPRLAAAWQEDPALGDTWSGWRAH